jgi:hypothetical protein
MCVHLPAPNILSYLTLISTQRPGDGTTQPRDPLGPPPPCFSRAILAPSESTTYEPLPQPFVIHGKSGKKFLDEETFASAGTPALYKYDVLTED